MKPKAVLDVECYPNYFCICIKDLDSGVRTLFEGADYDRMALAAYMQAHTIVTFNGTHYDMEMIALTYYRPEMREYELFIASSNLIGDMRKWAFRTNYDIPKNAMSTVDHIDLIDVAFGKGSLKLYAGRLHAKRMQDLPFDPSSDLADEQKDIVREYCWNDIENTCVLYEFLKPQIELREQMGEQYGTDLRSKSDAQIAEAVISAELKKLGLRPHRPKVKSDAIYRYKPPSYLSFKTDQMRRIFQRVIDAEFTLDGDGKVVAPPQVEMLKFQLGYSTYKMGIGGLHSSEKSVTHKSDDRYVMIDKDVESYYPSMIINNRWFPLHLGEKFLEVYQSILERRVHAKRTGDKLTNATLKIVVNGSFGKLGDKWSVFYSPDLMIQTTLTGQFSILMLIEELELRGFSVVSANTDGFVTKVDRAREAEYQAVCDAWMERTSLKLEEARYKALYSRDISNYIAFYEDGKVKLKGDYRPSGIDKNPDFDIVSEAVVAYLRDGTEPSQSVRSCRDVRKFVAIQKVTGGAAKDGEYLGKVIRSYKARKDYTPIKRYAGKGNVQLSYGSKPLMELPEELPADIDFDAYERMAWKIIRKDFEKFADRQMDLFA